jgi:hypothetical protein
MRPAAIAPRRRPGRRAHWGLALPLVVLAGCASVPVEPPPETPVPPPDAAAAPKADPGVFARCRGGRINEVLLLDETRRRLEETVCGATLWFDGLFGQSDVLEARRARGRVEVATSRSEFEGQNTKVRFNARVRLPALQQRLSAFVGLDENEEVARDRSEGLGLRSEASQLEEVDDFFAGLGYTLEETWGVRTDFRIGVRGLRDPRLFAQTRASYVAWADDVNLVELRATPFVNTRDGMGLTVAADFDHALAPTRLLRWGSVGTVTERSAGLDWRSALILYQSLRDLRAIAYEGFVRGLTAAPEPLAEYGARLIFREPLLRARLFANVVAAYTWPRVDPALPREGSAALSLGLEMPFGARD